MSGINGASSGALVPRSLTIQRNVLTVTAIVNGSANILVDFSDITVEIDTTGDPNMTAAMIEPNQPSIAAASSLGDAATHRTARPPITDEIKPWWWILPGNQFAVGGQNEIKTI